MSRLADDPRAPQMIALYRGGMSQREIAKLMGVSKTALQRLFDKDGTRQPPPSGTASPPPPGLSLHGRLEAMVQRLEQQASGSSGSALIGAVRELRLALAELSRLGGAAPAITVEQVEGWPELRTQIIEALLPYPEAHEAVLRALTPPVAVPVASVGIGEVK